MLVGNVRISCVQFDGDERRFLHVAHNGEEVVADCRTFHDEETDFLDCPVASRWTIVRSK